MAIISVGPTSTYPSIAAAMPDVVSGDTVALESGYSDEIATIALSGVTVDGDATSTGITLQLGSGIATFALTGDAPFAILDGPDGNGIVGNDGDNVITVSSGVDAVDGGAGIDRLIVDYRFATGSVTGDSTTNFTEAGGGGRAVTITNGTIENFTIFTGGQADTITTGDGDDLINVSAGANTVTAGDGNNTVTGGADADTFTVGDGNNLINAGNGANTVIAGQGVNIIVGGNGSDVITALDGGNVIEGGDGFNTLTSGGGDDTIISGTGAAIIVAGAGADLITVKGGAATVGAGAGNDQLTVDYTGLSTNITGGITGGSITIGYTGHIDDAGANSVNFHAESVASDATTPVINVNDLPTGSVTITGTPTQGEILTASQTLADEDGLGTIGFQWRANGVDIDGATDTTFTLTQAQVGAIIDVRAVYTDQQGTPEGVLSDTTNPILNVNDASTGAVIITGTPTEDQTLTASNTLVDPDGLGAISYQWQADGANIAGATTATLILDQAQVGSIITVLASYTDGGAQAESIASDATTPVINVNDLPTGSVTITGTPTQGEILTASQTLADEDGLGTIGFQWQANGVDIDGATGNTFTLTQTQVSATIDVRAFYTDQQGTPENVLSDNTSVVAPPAPFYQYTLTASGTAGQTQAVIYHGPVGYLQYEFAGSAAGEAVLGTSFSDFIHLGARNDAANGGAGDDVIDGGTGSNFLTGGAGRDVFFLDGRNGETTWSTITDWHAGEEVALWGWVQGVSKATWLENAGVESYRGATMHADLDGNGVIDTSVTWSGLTLADVPAPTQQSNLLWFA